MTEETINNEEEQELFENEEEKEQFLESVENTLTGDPDNENPAPAEISIGLTPVGAIGIKIQDEDGNVASYFIFDPSEAWQLAGHLQSLATIAIQARYALALKEQQMMEELMKKQNLYVPGQGII